MQNISSKIAFFLLVFNLIFSLSCSENIKPEKQDIATKEKERDSIDLLPQFLDTFPKINYNLIKFKSNSERIRFLDSLSDVPNFNKYVLMTLNRKQWSFLAGAREILVPDQFFDSNLPYSIFPTYYEAARRIPKIIIVSNHYQAMAAYEYGNLVKFSPVSSGKEKTQTYPGKYSLIFRQRVRHSSVDSNWVLNYYFNFHPQAGMAMHEFTLPGYPASHSCVRMLMDDAKWVYDWGKQTKVDTSGRRIDNTGTPVLIVDHYPFGAEFRPWMQLTNNKDLKVQLPDNPLEFDEPLIPIIQIPKEIRGSLVNKHRYEIAEDSLRKLGIIRQGVVITPSVNFNKLRRQKEAEERRKQAELEKLQQLEQKTTEPEQEEGNQ